MYGLYTQGTRPGGANCSRGEPFFSTSYASDLPEHPGQTPTSASSPKGIDKLTSRHGLALQDRGLNAQYIDASAHCEVSFKSKHARKTHIPVTELVNLSVRVPRGTEKDRSLSKSVTPGEMEEGPPEPPCRGRL